jgi:hypothetical protein
MSKAARQGRRSPRAALLAAVLVLLVALPATASAEPAGRCDPFDPSVCLQPWPNDYFTVDDPTTDTGKRVSLDLTSMPRNVAGKPIDPTDFNRNDGFSPGQLIVTHVPELDNQSP